MKQAAVRQFEENVNEDEDQFRSSLSDVEAILEGIAPFCDSLEEVFEILALARTNNGQLRMMMEAVKKRQ